MDRNKPSNKLKLSVEQMLSKLDEMYDKEESILKQIDSLRIEYLQLQQDKELLQMMLMHQSNKADMFNKYKKTLRGF